MNDVDEFSSTISQLKHESKALHWDWHLLPLCSR
jgi:hypothetical protein